MEIWKNIDANYQASNTGLIRSMRTGIVLKSWLDGYGYPVITWYGVTKKVHRLVLATFEPRADMNALTVNHKNFIKTDNRVENLEWMTAANNVKHARNANILANGERVHTAILTENDVIEIKRLFVEHKLNDTAIGDIFGVSNSTISNIRRKIAWKHVCPELEFSKKSPTGRGKLTDEIRKSIISGYAEGKSVSELAISFEVHKTTIRTILAKS